MTLPEGSGANNAAMGWLEHGNKRDAIDFVRGYAAKHMESPQICWFAVMPLLGGWLWEIQEGGPGRSYLNAVAKALAEGVEQSWFRVGNKAYSISMRDGRPFCVLLSAADSKVLFESDKNRLIPKGAMQRVVNKGTGIFVFGLTTFFTGVVFLGGAVAFSALSQQFTPTERVINTDTLPHRQWSRVENVPPNLFVESLRLGEDQDQWQATVKPIQSSPSRPDTTPSPVEDIPPPDAGMFPEDPGMPPEPIMPTDDGSFPVEPPVPVDDASLAVPTTEPMAPVPPPMNDPNALPFDENGDLLPVTDNPVPPPPPVGDIN